MFQLILPFQLDLPFEASAPAASRSGASGSGRPRASRAKRARAERAHCVSLELFGARDLSTDARARADAPRASPRPSRVAD